MVSSARKITNPLLATAERASSVVCVSAIEMIDVCRTMVIDHLSLVVDQGEIFGLFGPPGSGKTTIISLLCGRKVPSSGKIKVMGYDLSSQAGWVSRHMRGQEERRVHNLFGVASQTDANTLDDAHTAYEHLRFHANLIGLPKRKQWECISKTLAEVGLAAYSDIGVRAFSADMKCRLAIARALLHGPRILYLDEPTLGVYGQARHALWHDLRLLCKTGKTMVLATCDWEEAQTLCNRVAMLDHGKLRSLYSIPSGSVM